MPIGFIGSSNGSSMYFIANDHGRERGVRACTNIFVVVVVSLSPSFAHLFSIFHSEFYAQQPH